jgi:hypothetical protein
MDQQSERLDALEQQMHSVNRRLRWWRGLACGAVVLAVLTWALPAVIAQEEDAKEKSQKRLAQRVAALEKLLKHFSREGKEIFITGPTCILSTAWVAPAAGTSRTGRFRTARMGWATSSWATTSRAQRGSRTSAPARTMWWSACFIISPASAGWWSATSTPSAGTSPRSAAGATLPKRLISGGRRDRKPTRSWWATSAPRRLPRQGSSTGSPAASSKTSRMSAGSSS